MKYCLNKECPGWVRGGKPVEHDGVVENCTNCGGTLTPEGPPSLQAPPSLIRKLLVTLVVLGCCIAAKWIPLPTVVPKPGPNQLAPEATSVMALGVNPLVSGYVLVELAALGVPAWRRLRVGGPEARAKLNRASILTGMVLTTGQSLVLCQQFKQLGFNTSAGLGFYLPTTLILLGAAAGLLTAAGIVDQEGLGGGFAMLLLSVHAPALPTAWVNLCRLANASHAVPEVLAIGAVDFAIPVLALLWMFGRWQLPAAGPMNHPSLLSRPACGVTPFGISVALIKMLVLVALAQISGGRPTFGESSPSYLPLLVLLSIAGALIFAFLFIQPEPVAAIWRSLSPNPPEGIPRLKSVLLECVLFIVAITMVHGWAVRMVGGAQLPGIVATLLVTGILFDLAREWRTRSACGSLVSIWEIHHPYAIPPAQRLLSTHGIQAFPKGEKLRSLLQFFGPYAPIHLMVPAHQAHRARALIESRWPVAEAVSG